MLHSMRCHMQTTQNMYDNRTRITVSNPAGSSYKEGSEMGSYKTSFID